ncbi:MAG: sulfite exporter TauE/SafE family protein [Clostridia bacterium]|nr:sulfite exporter TauE/SafE family protein [Clostridia bacterium]
MEQNLVRKILQIEGMTCTSCEIRIENTLQKLDGIIESNAIFSSSNVYIAYDQNLVNLNQIIEAIEKLDYKVKNKPFENAVNTERDKNQNSNKMPINQLLGIGIIIFALYVIIKNTIGFNFIPQVNQSMGYGILFVVGLLTSLHCIAMCGGINLSQCVSYKYDNNASGRLSKLKPSFMYNSGRVISYTMIGGIVGALGSAISFSGAAKGIVAILSGLFMVIMGINMMNIFPWMRKINPRMPKIFGQKIYSNDSKHGPFYIGLLNGLMPCGPLQAMQIYALGTGSFIAGATSMFLFSLGTVPLMFGFGAISSFLSSKFTHKMMKVSAVLVLILGIVMVDRGLNLSGINLKAYASSSGTGNTSQIQDNIQVVTTKLESGRYSPIIVQKGIPVKWTIKAEKSDLNGCNNPLTIPKYGISKRLEAGDNIIEFTPDEEGNINYTCWMGMISSNIKVVSDITKISEDDLSQNPDESQSGAAATGGCCAAGSKATKFYGGNIPTDDIQIAKIENNQQEVIIKVNDEGFSPAVVILKKGVQAKIKFNPERLNSCNNAVIFPEYKGQLDLQGGQTETPLLTPEEDFTFKCWMGMLNGYVKVVDDLDNIDIEAIKSEIETYNPPQGSSGSGGCCG